MLPLLATSFASGAEPPSPDATDPPLPQATPRPVERQLSIDDDGRVRDARGRALTTIEFAQRIGDEDTLGSYRKRRTAGMVTSTALTVLGGIGFTGGALFELGGFALTLPVGGPFDNPAFLWGGVVTGAGGALASAGIYGIVVGKRQVGDPRTWYRPETLRSLVDSWNAGDDPRWVLPTVSLSVGVGSVSVQGTF